MTNTGLRIAMYSHDAMGLGHLRRNLLIAGALRSRLGATVLMIAGAWEAGLFDLPDGVDCLTLPALRKGPDGRYDSKRLRMSVEQLVRLRGRTIDGALEAFEPDLLVVDKVPRGIGGELTGVLERVARSGRTRCVLGLRDVLDDAAATRREWDVEENEQAIARWYDAVWIYGDPTVYDAVKEYGWSARTAAKVSYAGYLDRSAAAAQGLEGGGSDLIASLRLPPGKLAVCTVGGGQDGAALARAFAGAIARSGMNGVIVTGPFMPADERRALVHAAAGADRLRVIEFVGDASELMAGADRVVTMGGYNSVCEVLSFRARALVVPRVSPRREQWVRARRLEELGLLEVMHPDRLSAGTLLAWLTAEGGGESRRAGTGGIDFRGLERLPELVETVCASGGGARVPQVTVAVAPAASKTTVKVGHVNG
jgi:predicted glycosyltransferase